MEIQYILVSTGPKK